MTVNYYNTTNLTGQKLQEAIRTAEKQQDRVYLLFVEKGAPMMPCEVHKRYCLLYPDAPITSIRRSITNLTDAGYLEKTDLKGVGKYGKVNFKWRLKQITSQLNLFG